MAVVDYRLYCNKCGWLNFPFDEVEMLHNLEKNQVEYHAICPACGGNIFNSRPFYG